MSEDREVVYVVKDWGKIYENNRSRVIDDLRWVPIPNKHDSLGFSTLIREKNGVALYGAWCLIIQVASKCRPRGRLVNRDGVPLTARAIGVMTGAPPEIIQDCLDLVTRPEIAWITPEFSTERQADVTSTSAGRQADVTSTSAGRHLPAPRVRADALPFSSIPFSSAVTPSVSVTVEHASERKPEIAALVRESAERMYRVHPKKKHLARIPVALSAALNGTQDARSTLMAIEGKHAAMCQTRNWTKEHGRFAPPLDEWLDDKGFTADIPIDNGKPDKKLGVADSIKAEAARRIAQGRSPL